MRTRACSSDRSAHAVLPPLAVVLAFALIPAAGRRALGQPATQPAASEPADAGQGRTVEGLFADYLHFARMGSFDVARRFGTALTGHPDFKPATMLELAEKYRNSRETLLLLVSGGSLRDTAERIIQVIQEGEVLKRKSAEQITGAIELLAGTPTQRAVGMERLKYAGEYAVKWLVAWLVDPGKSRLYPFIERALPQIGRPAVNPLVAALRVREDSVRETLMDALAELGYPQALPYLKRIAEDSTASASVRETANRAVARILRANPGVPDLSAAAGFLALAEDYYKDSASLRPTEPGGAANVWFWQGGELVFTAVPSGIFNEIQAMRCCEEALRLQPDLPAAVALWLAANFRREAELGMDVQSVAPDEKALADATRPQDYPRSLYFARCFGPRYVHLTLSRAVKNREAAVALGAVTALDGIASASELVGPEDVKQALIASLEFPDVLVRINAALALAHAMPPQDFHGARQVVPILASALDLRGRQNVVIMDPDEESRRLLADLAERQNAAVIAAGSFTEAVNRVHEEMTHVDLVLLATDLQNPPVIDAIRGLRGDDRLELAPVVIVVKPGGTGVALRASSEDARIERLAPPKLAGLSDAEATQLSEAFARTWERARRNFGRRPIAEPEALDLAMRAATALRLIAMTGTSVFQMAPAEPALIRSCSHPVEQMRLTAAATLAWSNTRAAQSAIATLALDAGGSTTQRIAALDLLAESAKRYGRLLPDELVARLTEQALHEKDLTIRTAASRALGALDLGGGRASEIIHLYTTEPKP